MRVTPEEIGPYRILELLGEGSMGVVYRAAGRDGQVVALKTVLVPQGGLLQSIRREIHALARVQHPGVVRILDEGLWQGVPWYAMELLEGATLRQHCNQRLELRAVLTLVRRLCTPLAYLHGEGIVHRDLKPDNVFLRQGITPVLVDFGLVSRFGSELSRESLETGGAVSGTAAYMAPEQARGELVDARTDLYALGCMLYELVAGRPPFVGQVPAQVLWQHFQAEPVPPSRLMEGLPPDLDALILRLLAKRPRDRLGHADDVAAALAALGAEAGEAEAGPRPRAYLYRPGFTGRDEPLRVLSGRLSGSGAQGASDQAGGMSLIGGESGVGKTRLVMELATRAKRLRATVLVGECQPLAAGAAGGSRGGPPLHPLRGVLQAVADRCREKGLEETERLLGRRGKVLALYEPALQGLPGQVETQDIAALPAEAALLRLYTDLTETIAVLAAAEAHPAESEAQQAGHLLLILDDLQWADDLTLGWLEHLIRKRSLEVMRVLIVGTYRTEELGAGLRRILESLPDGPLQLGRLDQTAIGSIVGDMLALEPPPETFVRFLTRQSEGNPFFVAEYLRTAVAEGLLLRDGAGHWRVSAGQDADATEEMYAALPLPRSLRDLAGRRFEGLSLLARQLTDAAAVLGREMDEALLAEVARIDPSDMMDATHELIARQVLEEQRTGTLRFAHDKLREVAYEGIGAPRRRELHRFAAEAAEVRLTPERRELLAVVGHHWEQAGEPLRARDCYLEAARAAKERHALGEAERLYRAYLRLIEISTAESLEARNELAWGILRVQGKIAEAIEEHRSVLEDAVLKADRSAQGQALQALGGLYNEIGKTKEARESLEQSLALYQELVEAGHRATGETPVQVRREEGTTLGYLANLHIEQGRMDEAREMYQQALAIAREVGHRPLEALTVGNLANLHKAQGRLGEAEGHYAQAVVLAREIGHRRLEGITLSNFAILRFEQGRLQEARTLHEQALSIHRELGHRRFEGATLGDLALVVSEQGRFQEAQDLCQQALTIHRELGNPRHEGSSLSQMALLQLEQGRVDEASTFYHQALELHREVGDRQGEGVTLRRMSALSRRAERSLDEARRLLEEAEALLGGLRDQIELGLCLCERGHLCLASGQSGRSVLGEASEIAAALGLEPESELGKATVRLRRAQEAFEAGAPLILGECAGALPPGLRRRHGAAGRLASIPP